MSRIELRAMPAGPGGPQVVCGNCGADAAVDLQIGALCFYLCAPCLRTLRRVTKESP